MGCNVSPVCMALHNFSNWGGSMRPLTALYARVVQEWDHNAHQVELINRHVARWFSPSDPIHSLYFVVSTNGVVKVQFGEGPDIYGVVGRELGWSSGELASLNVTTQNGVWTINSLETTIVLENQKMMIRSAQSLFEITQWGNVDSSVQCAMRVSPTEKLFGLGEKVGGLDKRGRMWTQWTTDVSPHGPNTDPLYQAVPFAVLADTAQWRGVFVATSERSYFDASQEDLLYIAVDKGPMFLYVIPGTDPQDIIGRYTAMTGRMPLPSLMALGFHQSRYSYMSSEEVLAVAQKFREHEIPLDVIHLDIDYMDEYRVFTFNTKTYDNPGQLATSLKTLGVSLVAIVDPGVKVDDQYAVYREGHARGFFVRYENGNEFHSRVWPGLCAFPDFLLPAVRSWWGEWNKRLLAAGISGIWNDMNEPALWGENPVYKNKLAAEEYGMVHHTEDGQAWPHYTIHNLYALLEAASTFEGMQEIQERPFILTRSGFSGIQRYAAVWTGDNSSSWDHLAMAIPMCLNLGLSGIPLVGSDIGGFLGEASAELYTRWIQMGSFFPFVRAHTDSGTAPNEPWSYGDEALAVARDYIRYRYRLLSYWYSLSYESHITGSPLIRPLWWSDAESLDVEWDDQFLVGDSLMVAPVIHEGATEREVYFPNGPWWNVWERRWHQGLHRGVVDAPMERLPLFLRAGAIIPLSPIVSSTHEWQTSPWPDQILVIRGWGQFTLYADDGHSTAYQNGEYFRITLDVQELDDRRVRVEWSLEHRPEYSQLLFKPVVLRVGPFNHAPRAIDLYQTGRRREVPVHFTQEFCELAVDITASSGCVDILTE